MKQKGKEKWRRGEARTNKCDEYENHELNSRAKKGKSYEDAIPVIKE